MMRCASCASSGCTEIRTSLRPSTDSGKIECGTSEETTDITPCDSRRPRTICASMSEWVRKITTRSGNGFAHLVDLQEDHRHVVVLRRIADERGDFAQDALAELVRRQVRVRLDELAEARFAEAIVPRVHRFADAVGEEQVEVAGLKPNRLLDEQALEHLAVVELQADDHAVGHQDLHVAALSSHARAR